MPVSDLAVIRKIVLQARELAIEKWKKKKFNEGV